MAGVVGAAREVRAGVNVGVCAQLPATSPSAVRGIDPGASSAMRVLGVLTLETSGPSGLRQPTLDYWMARFRGPAARLGAEGVAGIEWVHFASRGRYFASALAVAAGSGDGTAAPCERVVRLEPIVNLCDAPEALRASDEETLRLALVYGLGRKGYYLSAAGDTSAARVPASLSLAVAIETVGGRPVGEGGPVRLRARLRDAAGAERWSGVTVEEFQDLADIGGALLHGTPKSRSGYLLTAVDRLIREFPPLPVLPASKVGTP